MLKRFLQSPLAGAVGAVVSWAWEAFWLIGPPVGISQTDRKGYLFWGMVAILVCGFQAFGALLRENKNLAHRLREIDDARPRIRLKEPGAVHCKMVQHTFVGKDEFGKDRVIFSGQVPFICVAFRNDPSNAFPKSVARGVRAYVEFFPIGHSVACFRMDGRWAESDQPPEYSQFKSKATLLETSFGFGESRTVDIAHISGIDGQCYAWNNDNYSNFDEHYLTQTHLLTEKSYRVQVRLWGEFVDETFVFTLNIKPNGFGFTQPS
jgi:hypothetical protein